MTMRKRMLKRTALGWMAAILVASTAFGPTSEVANAEEVQPTAVSAPSEPIARTAAPAVELFSVFNPSHLYLDNGSHAITATTGKVTVNAVTSALVVVDSIGITFYVEKWSGSAWEIVGSGSTVGTNNATYYSTTFSKSVTAGYYYRARTKHWVIKNGTYEEGEVISGSVLGI